MRVCTFNIIEHGSIVIMIAVQEDQFVCEVVDNGDGMDIEQLLALKRNRPFISGNDDRIKLMYREKILKLTFH